MNTLISPWFKVGGAQLEKGDVISFFHHSAQGCHTGHLPTFLSMALVEVHAVSNAILFRRLATKICSF